ncbi:MAG: DUF1311 domain-containing protein [Methylocystaceae bacterium]|nr:DUF1311 domain-containing protein [Methylocystaceae bacterium]
MQTRILIFLLMLFHSPAWALDCDNANTTAEMVICADQEFQKADQQLNKAYQALRQDLDDPAKALLKSAQLNWIKFRDSHCLFERDKARGGTIAPLMEIGCLTTLTQHRTVELQAGDPMLDDSASQTIWLAGQKVTAAFDCKEEVEAKVGLLPSYNYDLGKTELQAHVQLGFYSLFFPIQQKHQDSLCGPNVTIKQIDMGKQCPGLRLDDGLCDAFLIYWDEAQEYFQWERN